MRYRKDEEDRIIKLSNACPQSLQLLISFISLIGSIEHRLLVVGVFVMLVVDVFAMLGVGVGVGVGVGAGVSIGVDVSMSCL